MEKKLNRVNTETGLVFHEELMDCDDETLRILKELLSSYKRPYTIVFENTIINKTQNKMTTLETKLNSECLQARKDKDSVKANLLLTIKGQVQNAQKNPDTASDIDAVINASAKSILKGLETVTQTEETKREKEIASEYLPQLMSLEEVKLYIGTVIHQLPYPNIGACTGIIMRNLAGKVDGKIVKEALNLLAGSIPEQIKLTSEDAAIVGEALLNPPPATEKFKQAQANHAEFIKTNNISVDPLDGDEGSI